MRSVHSDDVLIADSVDPESMPGEVEGGVKGRQIVQYKLVEEDRFRGDVA
jgi:hypothetical protein